MSSFSEIERKYNLTMLHCSSSMQISKKHKIVFDEGKLLNEFFNVPLTLHAYSLCTSCQLRAYHPINNARNGLFESLHMIEYNCDIWKSSNLLIKADIHSYI